MKNDRFIDFAFVKEQSDFLAVLDAYGIAPRRRPAAGKGFKIICPFHNDQEPSLSIDPAKKRFHCFGCHTKGNILDFVAEMDGLDRKHQLRQAATRLADICGVALAETEAVATSRSGVPRRAKPASQIHSPVPAAAPQFKRNPSCYALRFIEHDHPYLAERGISPERAKEFGVGFYAGKGSMRERIVIPIEDWWPDDPEDRRLVAYIGRWPSDDVPEGKLRYRTPKEFEKHQVLYNLHRIVGARHTYVVEGYFDVIAIHTFGFPAVALMGSSISPEQVELLWRAGVRYTTVLMDGNPEGRAAAPAVHQALGERGFFSRIGKAPDNMDPASMDREAFLALHRTER